MSGVLAIQFPGSRWFVPCLCNLGYGFLHSKGEFILGDPGAQFRILVLFQAQAIHGVHIINDLTPCCAGNSGRVIQIQDGCPSSPEPDALMTGRKKAAAPESFVEWLAIRLGR